MEAQLLQVKILTPLMLLFEGKALSVSSVNSEGRFDILPQHANFITLIARQPVEVRDAQQAVKTFNFSQAIIYSKDNQVVIYAEPLQAETEGV